MWSQIAGLARTKRAVGPDETMLPHDDDAKVYRERQNRPVKQETTAGRRPKARAHKKTILTSSKYIEYIRRSLFRCFRNIMREKVRCPGKVLRCEKRARWRMEERSIEALI